MEPPGRPQLDGGVVPGQRGQLAGVGGLVQGEEDERQARVVAVLGEQGAQAAGELALDGDVRPLVRAEALENQRVVIAELAHVELHYQAVLDAHAGAFHDHVAGEAGSVLGGGRAA